MAKAMSLIPIISPPSECQLIRKLPLELPLSIYNMLVEDVLFLESAGNWLRAFHDTSINSSVYAARGIGLEARNDRKSYPFSIFLTGRGETENVVLASLIKMVVYIYMCSHLSRNYFSV